MTTYGVIAQGLESFIAEMREAEKNHWDFSYDYIFQSHDLEETVAKLKELGATDQTHTIEICQTTEAFEFIEGSDYDGAGHFLEVRA